MAIGEPAGRAWGVVVAFLKVVKGGCPGQILELTGDRMVLGRHPNCDIVLDDAAVSRHHAQILQSHGNYYLEDLRSRNKTFLNNTLVELRTELHDADELKICDVQFLFHLFRPEGDDDGSDGSEEEISSILQRPGEDDSSGSDLEPPLVEIGVSDDDISSGASSIISTLTVKSASSLRLGVKPEVKLRAVLGISKVLAQTLKTGEVLQKTLDGLFKIFPQADEGFVMLKDPVRNKLVVTATKTRSNKQDDSVRVSMTIVKKALADCEAILSHDAAGDSRFNLSDSLTKLQIRSMMCVPLVNTQGEALGVIQIDTKDLKQQFSQDDLDVLVSVASQVTLAVENAQLHQSLLRQLNSQRDRERDAAEMELAVQVQLDFLPNRSPELPGYRFFDFYEAALHVGGDYFDYIKLSDGRMAVALGDVAGKGVPAALLMAKLSSSVRYHLLTKPTISEALDGLNEEISSSGLGHRFITFAIAVIDPVKHLLTLANAGHLPPILRSAKGEVSELAMEVAGIPLGVVRDQHFKSTTQPIQPGDMILLYTDGVTEVMNKEDKLYGRKRLKSLIANGPSDAKDLIPTILQDSERFADGQAQRDDVCLVCMQRD
ncbi:MAG: SpoIIE family protein phosphatase [Planctomycetes bacterium]|nr:SpoIIE family protein phosphatase [Planctomycetota bacterium]